MTFVLIYIMGKSNYYVGECEDIIKNAIGIEEIEYNKNTQWFCVENKKIVIKNK